MRDCCKTPPRRARYVVIGAVVLVVIAAALAGAGRVEHQSAESQAGAPASSRAQR